jgi:phosphoglycerate dehydrogenase-like enzyme
LYLCFATRGAYALELIGLQSFVTLNDGLAVYSSRDDTTVSTRLLGLAFGMKIIAWSQNMTPEIAEAAGARLVSKDELFRQADIVTIHLILSGRTKGLVGAAELRLMKPTSRLINTSRGPIVDEPSLIKALKSHAIAGAAIDVFDEEPLPAQHPFRSMDNVLATPHIGYVSESLYRAFYEDSVANITAWLDRQHKDIAE